MMNQMSTVLMPIGVYIVTYQDLFTYIIISVAAYFSLLVKKANLGCGRLRTPSFQWDSQLSLCPGCLGHRSSHSLSVLLEGGLSSGAASWSAVLFTGKLLVQNVLVHPSFMATASRPVSPWSRSLLRSLATTFLSHRQYISDPTFGNALAIGDRQLPTCILRNRTV